MGDVKKKKLFEAAAVAAMITEIGRATARGVEGRCINNFHPAAEWINGRKDQWCIWR